MNKNIISVLLIHKNVLMRRLGEYFQNKILNWAVFHLPRLLEFGDALLN